MDQERNLDLPPLKQNKQTMKTSAKFEGLVRIGGATLKRIVNGKCVCDRCQTSILKTNPMQWCNKCSVEIGQEILTRAKNGTSIKTLAEENRTTTFSIRKLLGLPSKSSIDIYTEELATEVPYTGVEAFVRHTKEPEFTPNGKGVRKDLIPQPTWYESVVAKKKEMDAKKKVDILTRLRSKKNETI